MSFSATVDKSAFIPIANNTLTNYEMHVGDCVSNSTDETTSFKHVHLKCGDAQLCGLFKEGPYGKMP